MKSTGELRKWHDQLDAGFWPADLPKPPLYGSLAILGARAVLAELLLRTKNHERRTMNRIRP